MPENGSTVLRQIVESLLITHTEAKLNSSGCLVNNNNNNNNYNNSDNNHNDAATDADNAAAAAASSRQQKVAWCEGLVRRPLPSFVTATRTSTSMIEKDATVSSK